MAEETDMANFIAVFFSKQAIKEQQLIRQNGGLTQSVEKHFKIDNHQRYLWMTSCKKIVCPTRNFFIFQLTSHLPVPMLHLLGLST